MTVFLRRTRAVMDRRATQFWSRIFVEYERLDPVFDGTLKKALAVDLENRRI